MRDAGCQLAGDKYTTKPGDRGVLRGALLLGMVHIVYVMVVFVGPLVLRKCIAKKLVCK